MKNKENLEEKRKLGRIDVFIIIANAVMAILCVIVTFLSKNVVWCAVAIAWGTLSYTEYIHTTDENLLLNVIEDLMLDNIKLTTDENLLLNVIEDLMLDNIKLNQKLDEKKKTIKQKEKEIKAKKSK